MGIDRYPWLFICLSHLQYDWNNPRQCGSHNLHQYKNQKQAFYLSNAEDIVQVGELVQLMKAYSFDLKVRVLSVDADAGYLGSFFKQLFSIEQWLHLCTLHMTKNAHVLRELKLFDYANPVQVDVDYFLEPTYYKKEKLIADRCDHYFVVSESEKMWVQNVFKRTQCTTYHPNQSWWGADDFQSLLPKKTCIDVIRSYHPTKKIILLPGRITYQKGIHLILTCKIPKNIHICIMSSTATGDENILQLCRNTIAQNMDHFSWIGPQFEDDKLRIMAQCDAVMCPSIYEPFGLLGLETLLFSSTLLIASGVDGMRDYLTEGGYLPCGTTLESVQNALNTFASMSEHQKASMSKKGREKSAIISDLKCFV
jgi:glycosyltransferase involved in cell wall biosynthesis